MNHILTIILITAYIILLIYTLLKILLDTQSTPKTLGYILVVTLIPVFGIIFYFGFGVNYRHKKFKGYHKQHLHYLNRVFKKVINDQTNSLLKSNEKTIGHYSELVHFLHVLGNENLTEDTIKLLINGENTFPEILESLKKAKKFIHLEYYAWENDNRGNQIKDILLKKAAEGVKVKVLYDDFASHKIKNNIVKELKNAGVEIHPLIKVKFVQFANLIQFVNKANHRDHRKIIIIDGFTGFIGGINISDRYDNSIDTGLYWRDTHVKITGPAVLDLQRHFVINWNLSQKKLDITPDFFPKSVPLSADGVKGLVQIVAGGPVFKFSSIMLTYVRIFTLAEKRLFITDPYFIPDDSVQNALIQSAMSGVEVQLMLPAKPDSAIVGAASRFYFTDLLKAGVKIYLYKKGFVHAKTLVADTMVSVVGTANLDIRSFDLNFEIMSVIYGKEFAEEMEKTFKNDLAECTKITYHEWIKNGFVKRLGYSVARLLSSFL